MFEIATRSHLTGLAAGLREVPYVLEDFSCSLEVGGAENEILRQHVLPYAAAIGISFLLIQDDSRPSTARLEENFLDAKTIQRL
ncbi:hypothetical protein TNCV_898711 [Trichonephila clavipes]|nr:hypothetical protein TNCV_898711 [Trichonephila clavipes]